jgi:endonuclease-3
MKEHWSLRMVDLASASRAKRILARLQAAYPDAHCELDHRNPFELLVATVLSAQTTDVVVNQVTPELFRRWPTAAALGGATLSDVQAVLSRLGMNRQKSRHIVGLSQILAKQYSGNVPDSLTQLVQLPGVGRKTANVVLGVIFSRPEGVVVDTHVQRLARRLGLSSADQVNRIEQDLMAKFDASQWDKLSHTLVFHGRRCCTARKPACGVCPVQRACPSAHHAEQAGRKSSSPRNRPAAKTRTGIRRPSKSSR